MTAYRTHSRSAKATKSARGFSSIASAKDHWEDIQIILPQHREKNHAA